jgi:hypothetical protein
MRALKRIPAVAYLTAWAMASVAVANAAGTDVASAGLAILGAVVLGVGTAHSGRRLGVRRSVETVLMASATGPWVALATSRGNLADAALVSAVASVLALRARAEAPQVQAEGLLTYFGLRQRTES